MSTSLATGIDANPLELLIAQFTDGHISGSQLVAAAAFLPVSTHAAPPTLFTISKAQLILGEIERVIRANSLIDSATLADFASVRHDTLLQWIRRGLLRETTPVVNAFAHAYTQAMARVVSGSLDKIHAEADPKVRWQALEGTFPRRFNKQRIIQGGNTVNVNTQVNLSGAYRALKQGIESSPLQDSTIDMSEYD
jgi:hypothetical protein